MVVKKASKNLLDKYKANIGNKEDFIEFNVRGEKARKIAEIAEIIKYLSQHDTTKSFQVPQVDFEKAYGVGKKGLVYVKLYLKKFGVAHPRVVASQDTVHIWSRKAA